MTASPDAQLATMALAIPDTRPSVSRPSVTGAESTPGRAPRRDRYIDSLRALALVRVVIYHLFGWAWLTVVFPSIPIMFALAGSLVASSLDRSPMNPWAVLGKRIRRLLPPLWLLGAVAIPMMLVFPWTFDADTGAGSALDWKTLLLWIVPIADPPGSIFGQDWTVALWYIRAYLWFLVLSPPALWLFRRWPARTMAVPFVGLILATSGVWNLTVSATGDVILTMATYGGCWLLGFAHHDNKIRTMSLRKVVPIGLVLMAAGLGYALTHQLPDSGYDLDEIPFAIALWGTGAVLLLLRFYPDFSWLARVPVLDKLISAINSRAMTIYLWNNPAIFLSVPLVQLFSITRRIDDSDYSVTQQVVVTVLLIVAATLLFGWVEDVAAKRRFRINPWPRTKRPTAVARSERGLSRSPMFAIAVAAALIAVSIPLAVHQGWGARSSVEPAASSTPQPTSDAGLPARVVSGYWQGWGNPTVRLGAVPAAYNTVMVSFAIGDGPTGKVTFDQSVQSQASFIADVDKLTAAGRKVLLSVGGANDGDLTIATDSQRKAFVASITKIIDTYHFQGIDWDLEHGFDPAQIAQATHDLTGHYGSDFLIGMAPTLSEEYQAEQYDLAARITDDLDLVAPQFYNGGKTDSAWIVEHTMTWAKIVGEDKVAMGFMTTKTSTDTGEQSPTAVCGIWQDLLAQAPKARGLMTWSVNLDQTSGYNFARECAPQVLGA